MTTATTVAASAASAVAATVTHHRCKKRVGSKVIGQLTRYLLKVGGNVGMNYKIVVSLQLLYYFLMFHWFINRFV